MKSNVFAKSVAAVALVSSMFAAGAANADNSFFSVTLGDPFGNLVQYRYSDRDDGYRAQYRSHDGYRGDYGHQHAYRHDDSGHHYGQYRNVDRLQAVQRERIRDGMRTGDLTPRESARLMAEQHDIERMQWRYMSDGYLSKGERQNLRSALQNASENIWEEKNDYQARDGYYPGPRSRH